MTIETALSIDASPAHVWSILTDFERYAEWNPFVRSIQGDARVGEPLIVRLGPPGKEPMTFSPVVLESEPSRALVWRGVLGAGWLFSGVHAFRLDAQPDGTTRFRHGEQFGGLLVPLLRRSLDTDTRAGFEEMNKALRHRAQSSAR
jgi:hypothetical protein